MVSSLLLACLPALLCCGGAIHQFPGKGVVPKPMRAEEVQRLKDRAEYEDGRTIDLTTIPFRPQDKVPHLLLCTPLTDLLWAAADDVCDWLAAWVGGWVGVVVQIEVLSGEFAFARGRITSVKETTVFVVVKKGSVSSSSRWLR